MRRRRSLLFAPPSSSSSRCLSSPRSARRINGGGHSCGRRPKVDLTRAGRARRHELLMNGARARALGGQVFVYEIKRVTSFGDSSSLFFARRRLPLRASRFDAARDQGIVNYTLVVVVVSFHAGAFHHHVDADAWRSRCAKIRPPPQRIERRSQTTKGREY